MADLKARAGRVCTLLCLKQGSVQRMVGTCQEETGANMKELPLVKLEHFAEKNK